VKVTALGRRTTLSCRWPAVFEPASQDLWVPAGCARAAWCRRHCRPCLRRRWGIFVWPTAGIPQQDLL